MDAEMDAEVAGCSKDAELRTVYFSKQYCLFCQKPCLEEDGLELGTYVIANSYAAHHYCVLASTNLEKTLPTYEEFFGVRHNDIIELRLNLDVPSCKYCSKSYATIICANCPTAFHLPCGLLNHCVTILEKPIHSFCDVCYPMIHPGHLEPVTNAACVLCLQQFDEGEYAHRPQCCRPNEFMHPKCLKTLANVGSFELRCPLCRNSDIFNRAVSNVGIYILPLNIVPFIGPFFLTAESDEDDPISF